MDYFHDLVNTEHPIKIYKQSVNKLKHVQNNTIQIHTSKTHYK